VANPFVVDFQYVRGKALTPSRLVVTQGTKEGLDVGVEMSLETPVVHSLPRTIGTRVHLLSLLLLLLTLGFHTWEKEKEVNKL